MKKSLVVICVLFIGITAFVDVKQNNSYQSNDYRDAFTGRYACTRNSIVNNPGCNGYSKKDVANIIVTKHGPDSLLQVKLPGGVFLFTLRNKKLSSVGSHNGSGRFFGNDSVLVNMPMGHASVSTYVGSKSN